MNRQTPAIIAVGSVLAGIAILTAVNLLFCRDIPPAECPDLMPQRVRVPDAENAYTYFCAATNTFYWPTNEDYAYEILSGKTNDDQYVREIIARNRQTLEEIDRGLQCQHCVLPEFDVRRDYSCPCHEWQRIIWIIMWKGQQEQKKGRVEQAVTNCVQLLHWGDLLCADVETHLQWFLSQMAAAVGCERCRQLACAPEITERQLALLGQQLDRMTPPDRTLVQCTKKSYRWHASTLDFLATQDRFNQRRLFSYTFHPNRTKLIYANFCRELVQNTDRPYAAAVFHNSVETPQTWLGRRRFVFLPNGIGRLFCAQDASAFSQWNLLCKKCREDCLLSGTRLVVACRVYQKANGDFPPTLAALVPVYLDHVPRDPYDGAPFRYVKERKIVYAVGTNGKDLDGKYVFPTDRIKQPKSYTQDGDSSVFSLETGAVTNAP